MSGSAAIVPCGEVVRRLRKGRFGWSQGDLRSRLRKLEQDGRIEMAASVRKIQQIEKSEPTRGDILDGLAVAFGVPSDALRFDIQAITELLVKRFYVQRNPEAMAASIGLIDEDIEIRIIGDPAVIPFAGTYHGLAGMEQFFTSFFSLIAPRDSDPPPSVTHVAVNYDDGTVVAELENDIVRLRNNPDRSLCCKVTCRFRYRQGKLVYFEDFFDTAAWARFLE